MCQIPKKDHRAVAICMHNNSQTDSANERQQYLRALAEEFEVDVELVFALADMLGPNEDYDGLIASLEDLHLIL